MLVGFQGAERAQAGAGTTVEIGAIKDNTLYESLTGNLSNGAGIGIFAGRTATGSLRRGLVAFDVASEIPAGAEITEATLTLQMTRTISGAQTIGLHRVLADWGEAGSNANGEEGSGALALSGDATWLHTFSALEFWSSPGGDFEPIASATQSVVGLGGYVWSSPQLVSDVQGWLDSPASAFGWALVGNESVNFSAKRFASRENGIPSFRPLLTVTFVPAPCLGDGDGNGEVDFGDLTSVLGNWLNDYTPDTGPGDANGDGVVEFDDITTVLGHWLEVCP